MLNYHSVLYKAILEIYCLMKRQSKSMESKVSM